jgi:hypothetical protein
VDAGHVLWGGAVAEMMVFRLLMLRFVILQWFECLEKGVKVFYFLFFIFLG